MTGALGRAQDDVSLGVPEAFGGDGPAARRAVAAEDPRSPLLRPGALTFTPLLKLRFHICATRNVGVMAPRLPAAPRYFHYVTLASCISVMC